MAIRKSKTEKKMITPFCHLPNCLFFILNFWCFREITPPLIMKSQSGQKSHHLDHKNYARMIWNEKNQAIFRPSNAGFELIYLQAS